jgi:peptide/nickel transport system substrate-binding protein
MHLRWKIWAIRFSVLFAIIGVLAASLQTAHAQSRNQNIIRAVMHSDLKIVDPIWTTAYITRNHGYMIYDTLFAMDEKGDIKPQMVDKYQESTDKLTYVFTLRDGLLWHDVTPVTADDCVASIKRWAARDALGQKLMSFVDAMTVQDAKTFTIKLKEPTGLVIFGLGKPSSNVPFMMPKRVAETDPNTQISDFTGSGPFVFRREEWKPGDKPFMSSLTNTSRAPSHPPGWRAARWSRSIASSGSRYPISSRPRTRCWPARSTSSSRCPMTCCRS